MERSGHRQPAGGVRFPDERIERLYRRALEQQWLIERDVDWDRLDLERIAPTIREPMSAIYSYIHYSEGFGLGVCGRIVDVAGAGWLRQFAATQVMDEARHVDFFARVLARLGATDRVPDGLVQLGQELRDVRNDYELLLHAQVIETAAQTLFVETAKIGRAAMQRTIRLPGSASVALLLECMIKLVARDEARHIAYGIHYLRERCRDLPAGERSALERRVSGWCALFQSSFAELGPQAVRLGVSAEYLLRRVWQVQRAQFHRLDLDIGEHPLFPRAAAP